MLEKTLKSLVLYAKRRLALKEEDAIYLENVLLHEFGLSAPYAGKIDEKSLPKEGLPDALLEELYKDLAEKGEDEAEAERAGDFVLGLLSPRPSEVNARFLEIEKKEGSQKALDYLLALETANHYFQKTKVERNLLWDAHYEDGCDLSISINLSKPEKNNKDIAKLLKAAVSDYPPCALCPSNLGYYGDSKHAARTNLRFVPLTLNHEDWYLQFSPYGYFKNHLIAFEKAHVPMHIDAKTFARLFDFVERFPSCFIGSNSDLPIVGGSILNHEHFQGGAPVLPLLKAKEKEVVYVSPKGSVLSLPDFYVSAIRLRGKDRADLEVLASKILATWRYYSDPENEILSSKEELHNTVTPFAEKKGEEYVLTLVLRNNRTSEEYPDGIFHAHPEYHAIKKEGIGLIEAAGLFILPARLKRQLGEVEDVVKGGLTNEEALAKYEDLSPFFPMIETLRKEGIDAKTYVNRVCQGILRNVAVYKDTPEGNAGIHRFIKEAIGQ